MQSWMSRGIVSHDPQWVSLAGFCSKSYPCWVMTCHVVGDAAMNFAYQCLLVKIESFLYVSCSIGLRFAGLVFFHAGQSFRSCYLGCTLNKHGDYQRGYHLDFLMDAMSKSKFLAQNVWWVAHTTYFIPRKKNMSTAIGLDSSHKFGGNDIRLLSI